MRKITALLLAAVTAAGCLSCADGTGQETGTPPVIERVVMFGVDGAGDFWKDATTPRLDEIFAAGAVTHTMQAMLPTITAQNFGSMLLGVSPEVHGFNNDIANAYKDNPGQTSPGYPATATGADPDVIAQVPSVFKAVRDALPDAGLACFSQWAGIHKAYIEADIGVDTWSSYDEQVAAHAVDYFRSAETLPAFTFIQFAQTDAVGHASGWGSTEFLEELRLKDSYIGVIYNVLDELGALDTTLFIVTADHGGHAYTHGDDVASDRNVYTAVTGPGVRSGQIGDMRTVDLPVVVLTALGIDKPQAWEGKVPDGIFA